MFKLNSKKQRVNKKQEDISQNPKILEVNLIKSEMPISFDFKKHIGTLSFALVVAILFILEIYLGLNWWSDYEADRLKRSQNRFNKVSEEIRQMKSASDQINSFRERVELADALLERHVYWSNFFTWLESSTLSSVSYQDFGGTIDGKYVMKATTQAFRDISWQSRLLLADPAVLSVYVDEGSGGRGEDKKKAGEVSFSIDLKINPEIFKAGGLKD